MLRCFKVTRTLPLAITQVAQTPHPGGIQVGLGDGSVRSIGNGVSGFNVVEACTPNGGDVSGSDW